MSRNINTQVPGTFMEVEGLLRLAWEQGRVIAEAIGVWRAFQISV